MEVDHRRRRRRPHAEPARIDNDRPLFGQRALTQRLARTMFFGSAATLRSAHKGIDAAADLARYRRSRGQRRRTSPRRCTCSPTRRRTCTPMARGTGTTPSHRSPAPPRTRPRGSVNGPRKSGLRSSPGCRQTVRSGRGNFAAVTVAPEGTGDIPDTDEARLVILHPQPDLPTQWRGFPGAGVRA